MITRSILGWGHDELLYEKKKRLRFGSRLESCIHGFSFRLAFALPPSGCLLIGKSSKKESTGVRSRSRILLMRSRIWNPFFLSRLFFIKFHFSNSNFCPFTQKATAGPKKELLLPAVWKVENEKPQKQTKNNLGMLNSHFMILFCYFSSFSPLSSASTFHLGMWKIALKGFLGMMGRMSCVCAMRFHWGSKSHRLDTTPGVKKYKKKKFRNKSKSRQQILRYNIIKFSTCKHHHVCKPRKLNRRYDAETCETWGGQRRRERKAEHVKVKIEMTSSGLSFSAESALLSRKRGFVASAPASDLTSSTGGKRKKLLRRIVFVGAAGAGERKIFIFHLN